MKQGVLLVAHGAPERVEDVEEYLGYVRGGRPGSPEVLAEVRSRYAAIGGGSPLLRWTRAQAEALERASACRSSSACATGIPFCAKPWTACARPASTGWPPSAWRPQFSESSVGLYIRRTREAAAEAGVTAEIVWAEELSTTSRC